MTESVGGGKMITRFDGTTKIAEVAGGGTDLMVNEWTTTQLDNGYTGSVKFLRYGNVVTMFHTIYGVDNRISVGYPLNAGRVPEEFRSTEWGQIVYTGTGQGATTMKMNIRDNGALQVASEPTGTTTYAAGTCTYIIKEEAQ